MEAPIVVPFVPMGGRPPTSERLGLGQMAARPESTRPLHDPDESAAARVIEERRPRDQSRDQRHGADGSEVRLAAQARIAALTERHGSHPRAPTDASGGIAAMRRRVEIAVRLGLAEEPTPPDFSLRV